MDSGKTSFGMLIPEKSPNQYGTPDPLQYERAKKTCSKKKVLLVVLLVGLVVAIGE